MVVFKQGICKKINFNVKFVLIFYNLSLNPVQKFQLTLFLCQKIRNYLHY
jgi:hypothetical protein